MRRLKGLIIFTTGALLGGACGWYFTKSKYEQRIKIEIDDVKAAYHRKYGEETVVGIDNETDEEDIMKYKRKEERKNYSNIIYGSGYDNTTKKEEEEMSKDKPYVISPDAVGIGEYDVCSLNYYADGVITDDLDEILDDLEVYIGDIDPKEYFGEYEDDPDIVYVRNDKLHLDYEIARHVGRYVDMIGGPEE